MKKGKVIIFRNDDINKIRIFMLKNKLIRYMDIARLKEKNI